MKSGRMAPLLALSFFTGISSAAAFEPMAVDSVVSVLPDWGGGVVDLPAGVAPEASGVAIAPDGFVATALHAVERAEGIEIRLANGQMLAAEFVAGDSSTDIALLKVEEDIPVPLVADTLELEWGDEVCAVGNAFGLGLSVTCGVVSAVRRTDTGFNAVEDFIQTDAAVNPGMSGGALVDREGRLLGLLSAIFANQGDANAGVNFAVSVELLQRVASDLEQHGKVLRGKAGLKVRDATRQELRLEPGAIVTEVESEGSAARAGLTAGDRIVEIAGRPIASAADVRTALYLYRPDESFYVTYRRGELRETVTMTLEPRDS